MTTNYHERNHWVGTAAEMALCVPVNPGAVWFVDSGIGAGDSYWWDGASWNAMGGGGLTLIGTATVWEDLRVPVTSTKLGGTKDPHFTVFKTNGAGSQGVFLYWFDKTTEEELYFTCQVPHAYKEGTNLIAHIHWIPKTNGGANAVVSWGLEYTWANHTVVFANTSIIYTNTHLPADASLVADKHYMSSFAAINGAGKTISSMLVCRVFRDAGGTGLTDDYNDDAGMLEIDFHFENDTMGSKTETAK